MANKFTITTDPDYGGTTVEPQPPPAPLWPGNKLVWIEPPRYPAGAAGNYFITQVTVTNDPDSDDSLVLGRAASEGVSAVATANRTMLPVNIAGIPSPGTVLAPGQSATFNIIVSPGWDSGVQQQGYWPSVVDLNWRWTSDAQSVIRRVKFVTTAIIYAEGTPPEFTEHRLLHEHMCYFSASLGSWTLDKPWGKDAMDLRDWADPTRFQTRYAQAGVPIFSHMPLGLGLRFNGSDASSTLWPGVTDFLRTLALQVFQAPEVEAGFLTKHPNPRGFAAQAIAANDTFHLRYPDQKLRQYDGAERFQPGIADQEPANEPINGADWRRAWWKQADFADYYAGRDWMIAMFDVPNQVGSGPWPQYPGLAYPATGVIERGYGVSAPGGDGSFGDWRSKTGRNIFEWYRIDVQVQLQHGHRAVREPHNPVGVTGWGADEGWDSTATSGLFLSTRDLFRDSDAMTRQGQTNIILEAGPFPGSDDASPADTLKWRRAIFAMCEVLGDVYGVNCLAAQLYWSGPAGCDPTGLWQSDPDMPAATVAVVQSMIDLAYEDPE